MECEAPFNVVVSFFDVSHGNILLVMHLSRLVFRVTRDLD